MEIQWETASELNNDYFTIERSANSMEWYEVGQIKGAGTSNHPLQYSFIDTSPLEQQSYYRLKQTDYDGTIEYHSISVVEQSLPSAIPLAIYPNPAKGTIHVLGVDDDSRLTMYDLAGNDVSNSVNMVRSSNKVVLMWDDLPSGLYIINFHHQSNLKRLSISIK